MSAYQIIPLSDGELSLFLAARLDVCNGLFVDGSFRSNGFVNGFIDGSRPSFLLVVPS